MQCRRSPGHRVPTATFQYYCNRIVIACEPAARWQAWEKWLSSQVHLLSDAACMPDSAMQRVCLRCGCTFTHSLTNRQSIYTINARRSLWCIIYGSSSITRLHVQVARASQAETWRSIWRNAETTMRSTLWLGARSRLAQTRCAACRSLCLDQHALWFHMVASFQ